jgi:excisionase family DNA binding protein
MVLKNLDETRRLLGVSKSSVKKWVARGQIPAIRLGRRVLIHPEDIAIFINRNRIPAKWEEPERGLVGGNESGNE